MQYLSTILAALCLIKLNPTGAFNFAEESVKTSQVLTIVAVQLVPEFVLDFYCTFVEIYGGLSKVHEAGWSLKSGRRKNHKNFMYRLGDLPKWMFGKTFATVLFVTCSIIVCVKPIKM